MPPSNDNPGQARTGTLEPESGLRPLDALAPTERQALYRRAGSLVVMSILLIVCVGVVAVVVLRGHRRRTFGKHGVKQARRRPTDPWFESARRVGPRGESATSLRTNDDDDTVDLDPDELDDFNVDGDGGKEDRP
ncbi:MAG: hypothetical protein ACK4WH_06565 [Phycisphaerales bacterium]